MTRLVLHFAPFACSRVTMIALEETGAAFETRLVAFMAGEHRSHEYLALNPAGKVPLLMVDGAPVAQNSAILPLLAKLHPEAGLLPLTGDSLADAALQARISFFSADLHPLVTRIRMPQFFCDLPDGPARVKAMGMAAMAMQLAPLEAAVGEVPWLLGERWSVLDAYLFWVWFRITGAGFDAAPFPNLAAHHVRMAERPATRRAVAREAAAVVELEARGLAVPLAGASQ